MADLTPGRYQIAFTHEQLLTAPELRPGAPLLLLPSDGGFRQEWEVRSAGKGMYTIKATGDAGLYVGFDGEPDMHELALLLPEPRQWKLLPGAEPDTFSVAVPDAPMRLGLSLLRIYPPRIALAPEYGDPYQAWMFKNIG